MNNLKQEVAIVFVSLFFSVSCGHFNEQTYGEFDNASNYCKVSRSLIVIQLKMIPSDETLANKAKGKTADGAVVEA